MLIESEGSWAQIWAGRFRSLRLDRGLTLSELADAIGVSDWKLEAYEAGEDDISAADVWKISLALDVSIDELIGEAPVRDDLRMFRAYH